LTQRWCDKLSTIGKKVILSFGKNPNDNILVGLAESISDDGGLIIRKEDGSLFTANAGEVTLAKKGEIL